VSSQSAIRDALQEFATAVQAKMSQLTAGEPEDQLRGPFESLLSSIAQSLGQELVCTGETPLPDQLGRPDYAIHVNNLLAGYVELKAPGVGASAASFRGHNRNQFKRFSTIPNILYCDGNEWAIYRNGSIVGKVARLSFDVSSDSEIIVKIEDASSLEVILREFLSWAPFIPVDKRGKIDLKEFAKTLAPLCRMLRQDVADALETNGSALVQLAEDWRALLFPDATDIQFSDAYAQTVAFALLLGRSEGAEPLTLQSAEEALSSQHSLLSRALQVLTEDAVRVEMKTSLNLLLRVIDVVPVSALESPEDPWLYFYEEFLAAYDPKLRKDAGAYYTPVEVVSAQVQLVDDLLVNRLKKPFGFANQDVITLDPATGTGTYLLGIITHALGRIEAEQGSGAVPGRATILAKNLFGFELMVGPYAVAELRVSRALRDRGAILPDNGTQIFLTDTLESPFAQPRQLPLYLKPIAEQHAQALVVKNEVPVIVCLGNPPYDRHDALDTNDEGNLCPYGGWIRFGDPLSDERVRDKKGKQRILRTPQARLKERERRSILRDFIDPVSESGHGVHLHNLYNLYTYFWRWSLWKVFENASDEGPGIVSFISASSYLDGNAFCGMREHLRRQCDEVWILDLGGDGRGTRKSDNVFSIQTPVAIAIAFRTGKVDQATPAKVKYSLIEGTRATKLAELNSIETFSDIDWVECSDDWHAPFKPAGVGVYFCWPLLADIIPWQQSGVKAGRTWVIAPSKELLVRRWRELTDCESAGRQSLFKDSPSGRKVGQGAKALPPENENLIPISEVEREAKPEKVIRYAYRSFDRQYIFADSRLIDRPGPALWGAHSERQIYISSLLNHPLGGGPAVSVCSEIPDLHHFRGSYGAKEVFPLYRDSMCSCPNILPGLANLLTKQFAEVPSVGPEDIFAYIYGVLAQPTFTTLFSSELKTRELRFPITKDPELFKQATAMGRNLIWLHTYGTRFHPSGDESASLPQGTARCTKAIPGTLDGYPREVSFDQEQQILLVGKGEFKPVSAEVFAFDISGLKVVSSWLKYRMKDGAGRKSSPLDDIHPLEWTAEMTTELLELLWIVEATIRGYSAQGQLLESIMKGDCFDKAELPETPDELRKPPVLKKNQDGMFNWEG